MLPTISHDKALHTIYGGLIALSTLLCARALELPYPTVAAFSAAALVGVLKEVYDRMSGKGTADRLDVLATALGGAAIALAGALG